MNTLGLRQKLVEIARHDVGDREISRNQSPVIKSYWPATNYKDGYNDRAPYCAAAVCAWVKRWLENGDVLRALGLTAPQAEKWRCKSPAAFGWIDWAREHGVRILSDSQNETLHTGDIMVFDMSHIAILVNDWDAHVQTIEANTGSAGGRDGEGIFVKMRARSLARNFIRLLD